LHALGVGDDRIIDEAARMLTVVMSGLISLQLANEPGVPYSAGPRPPAVEDPPVVRAYEPHRRYAVSPTELSPQR
jgi:hypothetical protein